MSNGNYLLLMSSRCPGDTLEYYDADPFKAIKIFFLINNLKDYLVGFLVIISGKLIQMLYNRYEDKYRFLKHSE